MVCYGILWHIIVYYRRLKYIMVYYSILWYIIVYYTKLWVAACTIRDHAQTRPKRWHAETVRPGRWNLL